MTREEAIQLLRNRRQKKTQKIKNVATKAQVVDFLERELENVRSLKPV